MRNLKLGLFVLLLTVANRGLAATILHPVAVETFLVTPAEPSVLQWKAEGDPPTGPLEFVIRDYQERQIATGQTTTTANGLQTIVTLEVGFYDLEFPGLGQRFGILSLPPHQGPTDPYFAIDAAASWLVDDEAVQEGLAKALRRCGIGMARERLSWGQIQPAADQWQWEVRSYDRLRQTYAQQDVQVLELCHDAPAWLGRVGKYPADLVAASKAWPTIADRWRPTWGALELWNEPDISFSGFLPADQYVAVVKSLTYGLRQREAGLPLVGGVLARGNRQYLDNAARNGLLDCVDVFSFHTYGRAEQMESLVGQYRDWLKAFGREEVPLWITECGRPWKKGPPRPPADQDATSALDITMKGVEARACGIARYFPFVYPYYEENQYNFGMMGREATPLRSMAAYVHLVARLAGLRYLGDLTGCDAAVTRARVFGDEQQTVAVLYTGRVDAESKIPFDLPVLRVEGIDGRPLPTGDGTVAVPDGLSYVLLDRDKLGDRLTTDTAAMRMTLESSRPRKPIQGSLPIVLRYEFDPAAVSAKTEGYLLTKAPSEPFPLRVRAFNLSDQAHVLHVSLAQSPADAAGGLTEQEATAPPQGFVDLTWTLDLSQAFAKNDRLQLTAEAKSDSAGPILPLSIDLVGEPTLEQLLARFPRQVALPLADHHVWQPHIVGGGQVTIDSAPEVPWRLTAKFQPGDRWVYPQCPLPSSVDLSQFEGLVIRARCLKPGIVRVMLWEAETAVSYLNANKIIPDDGKWHTVLVRFSDLVHSNANAPDANGRLDLDQVRRISLGMNSDVDENVLEVSHLCLVGKGD